MHPVWVGIAEVTRGPTCVLEFSDNFSGAFAWWAAQAMDGDDFRRRVEAACKHYDLILNEFQDVQPAIMLDHPADYLASLINEAKHNANYVLYGTFHTYTRHDA